MTTLFAPSACLASAPGRPPPRAGGRGRAGSNQQQQEQQRIKLSRELMLKLSAALSSSSSPSPSPPPNQNYQATMAAQADGRSSMAQSESLSSCDEGSGSVPAGDRDDARESSSRLVAGEVPTQSLEESSSADCSGRRLPPPTANTLLVGQQQQRLSRDCCYCRQHNCWLQDDLKAVKQRRGRRRQQTQHRRQQRQQQQQQQQQHRRRQPDGLLGRGKSGSLAPSGGSTCSAVADMPAAVASLAKSDWFGSEITPTATSTERQLSATQAKANQCRRPTTTADDCASVSCYQISDEPSEIIDDSRQQQQQPQSHLTAANHLVVVSGGATISRQQEERRSASSSSGSKTSRRNNNHRNHATNSAAENSTNTTNTDKIYSCESPPVILSASSSSSSSSSSVSLLAAAPLFRGPLKRTKVIQRSRLIRPQTTNSNNNNNNNNSNEDEDDVENENEKEIENNNKQSKRLRRPRHEETAKHNSQDKQRTKKKKKDRRDRAAGCRRDAESDKSGQRLAVGVVDRPQRRASEGGTGGAVARRRRSSSAAGSLWPAAGGLLLMGLFVSSCLLSSSSGGLTGSLTTVPRPLPTASRQVAGGLDAVDSGSTSSTSEELSRAVLATMSTQSPLESRDMNNNNNGTLFNQQDFLPPDAATNQLQQQQQQYEPASKSYLDRFLDFGRIFIMSAIIVGDICGNSLVILSVCRHTKLRVTTNWFVVSLACADILVALFAMTFNASVIISGRWLFKRWVCDFWNSCDVLASTASILHLCCISIDRYIAIMRPLDYPMKITTRRVMYALCGVWISSALLSYIPIFTGIYTTAEHIEWLRKNPDQCDFVVNRVYAIVSSSISFWIPCCIMVFTYYRIYREATRQEKFIYNAQKIMPAPQPNHQHHHHSSNSSKAANAAHKRRSKSVAAASLASAGATKEAKIRHLAKQQLDQQKAAAVAASKQVATTELSAPAATVDRAGSLQQLPQETQPLTSADLNNNTNNNKVAFEKTGDNRNRLQLRPINNQAAEQEEEADDDDEDEPETNSGQSTPTKRSISKMKREHKAAKTLGIIMGVFILCWLPFFSWYTPQHICGHACDGMVPGWAVTILFWIGYFNSTLNPIIYAYFNHEFRDAFKKTLQWIFCCCQDLKCLRVNRPNDNQHYNCTYRSTQEIGLVSNG